jgi:sortase A
LEEPGSTGTFVRILRLLLLITGISCAGFYCYTLCDQYVYQAYENWAFDQQIAGHRAVTFTDYIREQTPFGFVMGDRAPVAPIRRAPAVRTEPAPVQPPPPPAEGALLGRIEVKRLGLSAMVRQGVDAKMLSVAVGHVPSTALPGQIGNFAVAAHRDTLFRGLKDIKKGDLVTVESPGGTFTYQVLATKIVKPSDVSVLRADGGGLISSADSDPAGSPGRLLTMITCYPFYYVGSAPKRFIVQAKLVDHVAGHCYTCG